ncbi:MAG: hypothetical protein II604_04640 [Bacteroidales bacterium]|nr:hypothetical protein [Bacteroidales bacterium]
MGCICVDRRSGNLSLTFQQGNNVLIEMTHMNDGTITDIEPAFDIIYGVYDISSGERIMEGSYRAGGRITKHSIGVYYFQLSHEDTESLIGTFKLELTIVDRNDPNEVKVAHANQLIFMSFEPRQNNDLI